MPHRHPHPPLSPPGAALLLLALLALPTAAAQEPVRDPIFEDRAAALGLDFIHFNGMTGQHYFPEMTGQGAALLDYDGDGDLDAYLVQGALLGPGETMAAALFPLAEGLPKGDRLYRNDLRSAAPGAPPQPSFVDVTAASGLKATGYGMGVAAGDYDGDGFVDLYVTNYGSNQMWRNNGDGTFRDTTAATATDDPRWSTSAAFLDFDRDGHLDLFVVNYVDFSVERNPRCYAESSRRDYCGPAAFDPVPDSLFRNRGDGTFEDVSGRAGIARRPGPGLGVTVADFDGDGWLDVYVGNDGAPNFLWINRRDGSFQDDALLAGVAVNRMGSPEASMGVTAADFDGDGDEDLFMTHLAGETNTLYVNEGGGLFSDRTLESGLGPGSLPATAFGTAWFDYDNDGWLDLLIANGAVRIQEAQALAGDPYPLDQPNQLFRNLGGRRFAEVSAQAGEVLTLPEVSRGAAFGDVDNDGDADVLVANSNGPARLLINRVGSRASWLGLALADAAGAPALGAWAAVERAGGGTLWRWVRTDGSYCSANDPRLLAGLGGGGVGAVTIDWPAGGAERWRGIRSQRYLMARRGAPAKGPPAQGRGREPAPQP